MFHLILTVLAIALIAGMSLVTVNYLPGWAATAKETRELVETGVLNLEQAFLLRAKTNGGVAPSGTDVDGGRTDGGLEPIFQSYYSFLPRPPAGYAWTYGYTSETQLILDGYAGNPAEGLYWFCLYPATRNASEGQYRGLLRAQQRFPVTQYYLNIAGPSACGRPLNSPDPASYPTPATVTFFVRYIPEEPPESP